MYHDIIYIFAIYIRFFMVQPIKNFSPHAVDQKMFSEVSSKNREDIHNLFKELATGTLWQLTKSSLRLRSTGARLREELHPFQMLMEIFADPTTREHFQSIHAQRGDFKTVKPLIWNHFLHGVGEHLEQRKEEIEPYVDTFAKTVKISSRTLKNQLQKRNYEELLSQIMQNHQSLK
jgi:hypothetical protein